MEIKSQTVFGFIIIYMVFVALYKERQLLGCKGKNFFTFLFGSNLCDNKNNQISLILREEKPKDFFRVYDKIVTWRRSYLLSTGIILLYHYLNGCKFDGIKMLVGILCGTFFIYFSFSFYDYHLNRYIEEDVKRIYDIKLKQ